MPAAELYAGPLAAQISRLGLTGRVEKDIISPRDFATASLKALADPPALTLHEEYVWNKD